MTYFFIIIYCSLILFAYFFHRHNKKNLWKDLCKELVVFRMKSETIDEFWGLGFLENDDITPGNVMVSRHSFLMKDSIKGILELSYSSKTDAEIALKKAKLLIANKGKHKFILERE